MLKIAQVIDRESRMNKMWEDNDNDENEESDEEAEKEREKQRQKERQAKRPNRVKFSEILKGDAFPTLAKDLGEPDDYDEESDNEEDNQ